MTAKKFRVLKDAATQRGIVSNANPEFKSNDELHTAVEKYRKLYRQELKTAGFLDVSELPSWIAILSNCLV